jgi:hypothetical protein
MPYKERAAPLRMVNLTIARGLFYNPPDLMAGRQLIEMIGDTLCNRGKRIFFIS